MSQAVSTGRLFLGMIAALLLSYGQLPNGSILAVEYKGTDRWAGAEDDRLIGGLWEELSGGRCRFVMVKDKTWNLIEDKLR